MKAKKTLAWLLVLCLALVSFSACGNQNNVNNETEETTDALVDTTPVEIEDEGIDFWAQNNASFDLAIEGVTTDFEIEIANGSATILSYKGTQEHLKIPAVIDGLPVTAIAESAFAESEIYASFAPRLRASSPNCPEPPKRSSTVLPSISN